MDGLPVRICYLARGRRKLSPYLQVADKKGRRGPLQTKRQGLAAQLVGEIPLAPALKSIEAFAEQNLAALFKLADGSEFGARQAGDVLLLGAVVAHDAVVEADLLLCEEAPVCCFQLFGLWGG